MKTVFMCARGVRQTESRGATDMSRRGLLCGLLMLVTATGTACSTAGPSQSDSGGVIRVVAAENFWGSIASQVGGSHVQVSSIITNPTTDPHTYEPTAANARAIASAQLVIENGIGYDPWVGRLIAADHAHIAVLNVGSVLGVPVGGNPHRWYNPADVKAIVTQLAADYARLDPAAKTYFARRRAFFLSAGLRKYDELISAIRAKYSGTPVGASESIFAEMAPALGLNLITPYSFLKAISEGTEVSAADKLTIDNQIKHHLIKIYVYNSQNVTPDVHAQLTAAKAAHIPVATITETLSPPTATFQAWQIGELEGIEAALAKTTGH